MARQAFENEVKRRFMARPPSIRYQFLCGREITKEDRFAKQLANYCYLVLGSVLLNHVQVLA